MRGRSVLKSSMPYTSFQNWTKGITKAAEFGYSDIGALLGGLGGGVGGAKLFKKPKTALLGAVLLGGSAAAGGSWLGGKLDKNKAIGEVEKQLADVKKRIKENEKLEESTLSSIAHMLMAPGIGTAIRGTGGAGAGYLIDKHLGDHGVLGAVLGGTAGLTPEIMHYAPQAVDYIKGLFKK